LTLTLVLALLGTASTVLLLVDFQLKLKAREVASGSMSSSFEVGTSPSSTSSSQVDGIIRRGEYAYLYRDLQNDLDLYWRIDESQGLIYLGMTCTLRGRMAISFEPTGPRMKGGDILVAYVKDGQVEAQDAYADQLTSQRADRDLGGTDDILEKAGSQDPQRTTIELVRKLDTKDGFDKPITRNTMRIQTACSDLPNFVGLYADTWTTIQVDFYKGTTDPASPP